MIRSVDEADEGLVADGSDVSDAQCSKLVKSFSIWIVEGTGSGRISYPCSLQRYVAMMCVGVYT